MGRDGFVRITGDRKRREAHGWSGKSVVPNAQGPRDRRILRGAGRHLQYHLPTTEEYAKAVFYKPGRRCRRKNDTPPQGREALAQSGTFRKEHCCE